jgi:hypothetical protein
MLRPIDQYFQDQKEPEKSCLQYLRGLILKLDGNMTESWKYGMPFFCYKDKMICYLWIHKKYRQPYLGIVEGKKIHHPNLIAEKRARMKILLLDPNKDLPVRLIQQILAEVLSWYRS